MALTHRSWVSHAGEERPARAARWFAAALVGCVVGYLAWLPVSLLLPGLDPLRSYVSEMYARGEPLSGMLRAADLFAGMLAAAAGAGALAWLGPVEAGRTLRAAWASLVGFGGFTMADALLPMACAPSADAACRAAEAAGRLPLTHYAHTLTSSAAAGLALAFLTLGCRAARQGVPLRLLRRFGLVPVALLWLATGWVLVSVYLGGWTGLAQRVQLLLLGGCFALVAWDAARLLRRPRLHVVTDAGDWMVDGESARPMAVLLSGLGDSWFGWDEVVRDLARTHQVVRFDRPGLGYSDLEAGTPSLIGEVDRIRAVLEHLRPGASDCPVVVVGHSLGGVYAEAFARRYPEQTAGLVLVDASQPPGRPPRIPAAIRALAANLLALLLTACAAPLVLGPKARRLVLAATSTTSATAARRQRTGGSSQARRVYGSARGVTGVLREYLTFGPLVAELPGLRARHRAPDVPVRVLAATGRMRSRRARERWLAGARELAARFGQAELRILSGSGHNMPLDCPDAIAAAVREVTPVRVSLHPSGHPAERKLSPR